jgi:holliday junction resolvase Hjr
MNKKAKGTDAERSLVHLFWSKKDWVAHRIAGSGSSKYPSPDIIASNNIRKLVIECKSTSKNVIYIPKEEINSLKKFGEMFGAEVWLAFKFNREEWLFSTIENMNETNTSYTIKIEQIKQKGLLFEELIN